ncbi:lysoplasmalogenase [Pseudomonas akapageensis]|uniref:lysoplasmalogenase n=1 Tax=Pseudomonas akapageensis TaxID=2609961 RepID=UPI001C4992B6|nr:lysoplasmalogenase [Pseudomonas akapageensis]
MTFLYGLSSGSTLICLLSKPLPVLALLGWLRSAAVGPYRRWVVIGLLFSLLGDMLLAWPADLFVFGLGAFLFAHLAYLKAYLSDTRRLAPLALILAATTGAVLLGVLASHGLGELLIPVCVYALAISAMLWRALACGGLAAAGALAFVFSDSLIGIDRFVMPFEAAPYLIILSYWLGQWGIAASVGSSTAAPRPSAACGSGYKGSA